MRDNGCSGCKYEHLKGSEKPCCDCANMHMDKYEPITNADRIRNMSDEELACVIEKIKMCGGLISTETTSAECYRCKDGYCCNVMQWLQSEAE